MPDGPAWNHNIHYHPFVLDSLPTPCGRVLDFGCGEGHLARQLPERADQVIGIDPDGPVIARARSMSDASITFVHGDGLTHAFEPESFDAVVSVAATHHVDLEVALSRMADLLRPGGVLAVVGLGPSLRSASDLWFDSVGFFATRVLHRTRNVVEVNAPIVWPPPLTHRQARKVARATLPGVEYRRRILFRHTLRWTRPT